MRLLDETIRVAIGTQDTTINCATGGLLIRELKLLEKYLPRDDKYKDAQYDIQWKNFTSGAPLTNEMVAGKLDHADFGLVTFQNVPSPKETLLAAGELIQSPKLVTHLVASISRVFSGFAAATVVGIALGLVIGRSRWLEDVLLPPLEMLRPIPAVAWIPLAILMFPSSELSMVFITFIGALFPILLNTIHGVEGVDARLIASARSLGTAFS